MTYLIFEIPNIAFMRWIGLTYYLSLSLIAWGSISIGLAFVTNARSLMAVRAFLGITVSGYFPGIISYFSLWYCKKQQTMRIAILFAASMVADALSGVLVRTV
ncbi:unnamed protein product [Rotaria sordida]|uniref:Major facilitator superfamily (MFS) profile domain-containing protein n=1 Tax=Rotaria sordida TaxID=392033 RepID=A0A815M0T9_9BILA|nr:unnamed protein product [Rotaria sordida]CAF1413529.1 unnamed protein product [Rotaria sordida]CAF1417048.1 unnamed protein product [Rotaria sordida]